MSFVTPPWNENVPDWQFDTFTTGYFVVSALTQEGTMKLTFDKTSTGPDSGLNALDPTVTYLEYEIYFNKEGGQNVLIPGSSVPIPSSIIRSPGWNYVKITDRVTVNGQDIGVGNPQKIDCWLITNTTPVPDYVYIDYVAIQRAGDVVGGGTINLGNVTGVLPVQHGGTAVTISTGRSAAVLNVEPVLKNVTLEGDLRSVSNALTIHGNVYTDFLHGNAFGTYGIPLANTTGVLPRWREADPHRTGTGNVLVANVDPIISNSLTVVGDIISSNIIGNVSLTNANGLLPVSAGGTGTTFKTGTGAVVLNTNAVFKGTTTMANVVANFSGNGVGLHTLNVSNATVGVLAVEHGGTGVTTKTGTGNVVLSDNPVLNNVTVSGGLTGNVFGNIFGQSAVLNTLTAPNITSETLFANTSVTTAQLYGNLVGQTSVVDTLLTAPNITSETLFANTSVKTSQLYGNLLGQTAVVDQSITTPTLTVSNNADILGNLSVFGNLVVASGNVVYIDSEIRTSEQIIVDNAGDGAALIVKQSGAQPIMEAQDDGNVVFKIYDEGSVAFASGLDNRLNDTSTAPTGALVSVLGNVSVSQSIDTPHVYGNISGQTAVMDFLVGDGWQVSNIVPANVVGLVQTLEAANANILTLSSNVNVLSANTDALSCYVRSNIDTLSSNVDTLSSNVDTLSSNVDTLSANTDALSSYVRSNIDTLSSNADTLSSNVDTLSANTDALSSYVRSNIDTLSSNVDTLSSNVDTLSSNIDTLSSNVDTLSANTDALSSYVRSNIDTLSSNVDTLSSNVDTLSSNVDTLSSNVDTLSANTDALSSYVRSNIDTLSSNVDTLSSNVDTLSANTDALSSYVRSNIDTLSSNVDTLSSNVDTLSANTDALSSYVRSNIDTLSTTVQGYTDTFTTGNLYATVLADLPTTIADSLTVRGNTRLQGNLIIDSGNVVYVESQVDISEQLVVHNQGTGPAVDVLQTGAESLARFVDDGNVVMQMYNWGNVAFASGHSDILNNTTQSPSDALVTVFGSFAADTIRGNISSSNVIGLDTSISDLWANAGDQQTEIIGLQSDTANLWSNAASQQTAIDDLQANAEAQQTDLIDLWSNAASQQTAIDDLQANAGAQQTDLIDLWSNAASQQTAIGDLQANTGSQQTEITGLLSDTANLWSNAQAQQLEIAQVTNDLSNVFVSLDTGTVTANVFIGDGSQLTNVGSSNASLLTEGTLSQGRLPTTIGNVSTTFIGDGSQLLNVGSSNASLLTEGTLSQERLPTTIGNASTTYVGAEANIVGNVIASAFIGDGSLLTNAGSSNASLLTEGTLSQERLPTTIGNASTTYYGDGGFLSNVSATVDVSNLDLIITSGYIEQDFDVLGNLTGNLVLANTDGTATAPAYAFRNDLGTGLYLGSNALGIAVDSTALATVSSDGLTVNGNISGAYILGNGALLEGVASSNASSLTEGVISQSVLPQTLGNALTDFVGNSLDVTGNVSGSYILGNGALLEGVASSNASSLTEGVISQSVLPQTLGNALTDFVGNSLDVTGNVSGSYILGNGALLEGVASSNASSLTEGVISQSVLPQTLGNALTDFVGNSLDASGNVSGSYILGNGFYLDDLNANNLSGNVDGELILTGNIDGDVIFTGELEADVLLVGGNLTFDVPIHLTTGTASNPTLSWANDTTTGIFFTGYGPAFSANGAQVATFGDEGLIVSNVTANMFIGDGGLLSNVSSSQTLRTSFVSEEQSISNVTLVANSLITATSEFTSVFLNGAKLAYVHSTLTDYTTTYVQDVANSTTTLTIEMVTPIGLGDIVDITIQTGNQSHDWYYRV